MTVAGGALVVVAAPDVDVTAAGAGAVEDGELAEEPPQAATSTASKTGTKRDMAREGRSGGVGQAGRLHQVGLDLPLDALEGVVDGLGVAPEVEGDLLV